MQKFNLFLPVKPNLKYSSKFKSPTKFLFWTKIYYLNQEIQYQIYKNEIYQKNISYLNFEKIIKSSFLSELNIIYSFLNQLRINLEDSSQTKSINNFNLVKNNQIIKYLMFYFLNKKNKSLKQPKLLKKTSNSILKTIYRFKKKNNKTLTKLQALKRIIILNDYKANKYIFGSQKKINQRKKISFVQNFNTKSNFLVQNLFYKYWFLKISEPYFKGSENVQFIFEDKSTKKNIPYNIFFYIKIIFVYLYLEPKFILNLTLFLKRKNLYLFFEKNIVENYKNTFFDKIELNPSLLIDSPFFNKKNLLSQIKNSFINLKISQQMLKNQPILLYFIKNKSKKYSKRQKSPKILNTGYYIKILKIFYKLHFLKAKENYFFQNCLILYTEKKIIDYIISKTITLTSSIITYKFLAINTFLNLKKNKIHSKINLFFSLNSYKTLFFKLKKVFYKNLTKNLAIHIFYNKTFLYLKKMYIVKLKINLKNMYNIKKKLIKELNHISLYLFDLKNLLVSYSIKNHMYKIHFLKLIFFYIFNLRINWKIIDSIEKFKLERQISGLTSNFSKKENNKKIPIDLISIFKPALMSNLKNSIKLSTFLTSYYNLILQIQIKQYKIVFNTFFIFYGESLLLFHSKSSIFNKHKQSFFNSLYKENISIKKKKLCHTIFSLNKTPSGFIFYGFYIFQKTKSHKLTCFQNNIQQNLNFIEKKTSNLIFNKLKTNKKIPYFYLNYPETTIQPSKNNIQNHIKQIKYIIYKSQGQTQENLIHKISPIINKWSNYYQLVAIRAILNNCDYLLMKMLWKWCLKRHNDKNNLWIKEKYFSSLNHQKTLFTTEKHIYLENEYQPLKTQLESTEIVRFQNKKTLNKKLFVVLAEYK